MSSDLSVIVESPSLLSKKIDVIVSGSIAAVESVKTVRALRRCGADVRVVLTDGGTQFVTALALEWASNNPVQTKFEGQVSHLGEGDALLVAPASANFVSMAAEGRTDSPGLALFASYLGQKKPVVLTPCMHQSLEDSPIYKQQLTKLQEFVEVLDPRIEEGKRKFPEPLEVADQVAHHVNAKDASILVTLGSTKGYLDEVRYVSNYSSGTLGSLLCEELYRRGFTPHAVVGSCERKPRSYISQVDADTNEKMLEAIQRLVKTFSPVAAFFCASVLDYVPAKKEPGKLRSGQEDLTVDFRVTEKIISRVETSGALKVAFKLEPEVNKKLAREIAQKYASSYGLDMLVINALSEVSAHEHRAFLADPRDLDNMNVAQSKKEVVDALAQFLETRRQSKT